MNTTITVRNHELTVSPKIVRNNGQDYTYYCTKLNLGNDPETGKQKQKSVTAKTQEELIRKLEKEFCVPVYPPEASISLSSWLDTWLNTYGKRCYRPSTISSYRYRIDTVINPAIGNIALKNLDDTNISRFYDSLEARGCSIGYVLDIHHILQEALNYAVCKKYLQSNPCNIIPLKKRPYVNPSIFSPKECADFKILSKNDSFQNIFGVLAGTGMRLGEGIGLSWDCVDFENHRIYIRNQITDIKGENGTGVVHHWQESPKNGSSHYIYFGSDTEEYLLNQKAKQDAERLKYGAEWKNEHNLVFTMPDGKPLNTGTVRRHFNNIVALLGREDLHVHSLRHTAASAAWARTHNLRAIQEMLGHNSPRTTVHYTSSLEEALVNHSKAVEGYWDQNLPDETPGKEVILTNQATPSR